MIETVATPFLWLIPALPAAGALIIFLFGLRLRANDCARIACTAVGLSFLAVLFFGYKLLRLADSHDVLTESLWVWLSAGFVRAEFGFYFDRLALAFCLIISGVGFLIHVYSAGYMHGDSGERRYFGYLNLFVASMLMLVTAENAFLMFLGWEGVGACSFLLIGHYYSKRENCNAALKAFLVTRMGDIFLMLGILLCAVTVGVAWTDLEGFRELAENEGAVFAGLGAAQVIFFAAVLLLLGAAGKSAQLPLQVWLPDAMAGPTPVSALIHAATMVTAGVYLIARFHVLFEVSPGAMYLVAAVGVLTAFYGGICAIVQTDIKRLLAFSTISQIGYMILALGVGAWGMAIFHFMTHAFYKALLFLGAGTVIHSLHGEQNIYNMGGLKKPLRSTYLAMLAGCASLAGFPIVTAGYWSKDGILYYALSSSHGSMLFYGLGLVTAFLTAVYSFKLIFVVFHGEPRKEHHVHAPGALLTVPLLVLAVFAIVAGWINTPFAPKFDKFMSSVFIPQHEHAHSLAKELILAAIGGAVALAGIFTAWRLFGPGQPVRPVPAMNVSEIENTSLNPYTAPAANFLFTGWFFDQVYWALFVLPYAIGSKVVAWFDSTIVDGVYELSAAVVRLLHEGAAESQNGRVPRYAVVMLFGAVGIGTILITLGLPR